MSVGRTSSSVDIDCNIPVGVVHANRLFSFQDLCLVAHHARLVQCRLAIEDENVSVLQVSVHLLVDRRRACVKTLAS